MILEKSIHSTLMQEGAAVAVEVTEVTVHLVDLEWTGTMRQDTAQVLMEAQAEMEVMEVMDQTEATEAVEDLSK